jgi:hypothetical protein
MTTGIREFCNVKFAEHLPAFQAGTMDGTAFRAAVMKAVVEQFTISVASAATHYNHSLKQQRIADARSVHNLGRPEGKKGGRNLVHPVTLIKARTGEVVQENISRGRAQLAITMAERRNKTKLAIREDVESAAAKAAAPVVELGLPAADAAAVAELVANTPA